MGASIGETRQIRQTGTLRLLVALAAPLAGVALAYGLWWISDRLLVIGPLDRAAFGWLVVIPVWSLTPCLTALAWHRLGTRPRRLVATGVGLAMAAAVAVLYWLAVAFPDCQFGAVLSPAEWIAPAAIVGLVVGGGFAAIGLGTTALLCDGQRLVALLAGAGLALALVLLTVMVAFGLAGPGACVPHLAA
jgi:hypothetical protein